MPRASRPVAPAADSAAAMGRREAITRADSGPAALEAARQSRTKVHGRRRTGKSERGRRAAAAEVQGERSVGGRRGAFFFNEQKNFARKRREKTKMRRKKRKKPRFAQPDTLAAFLIERITSLERRVLMRASLDMLSYSSRVVFALKASTVTSQPSFPHFFSAASE